MRKRILALMALLLTALFCFSGCSKADTKEENTFVSSLYEAKNPYIENTSADNDLVRLTGLGGNGKFTIEVQDASHPYTLMIRYMYLDNDVNLESMDSTMVSAAAVLLALIGDCEQVSWSYPGAGGLVTGGVTTEYINTTYDTDVKAAGEDEAAFTALCGIFYPDKTATTTEE